MELADRVSAGWFIKRTVDDEDQRRVQLVLTAGRKVLQEISIANLRKLNRLRPHLREVWDLLERSGAGGA